MARAQALNGAGNLAWSQGDYGQATVWYEESMILWQQIGDMTRVACALCNLGMVLHEQGDLSGAQARYEESLALHRQQRDLDRWSIAATLNNLGQAVHKQGDWARAHALLTESLSLKREIGDDAGSAATLGNLADLASAEGDDQRAAALYRDSVALYHELGDQGGIAACCEGIAHMAVQPKNAAGDAVRAARLLAAASKLRIVAHLPLPPAEQIRYYERDLSDLRHALGDRIFEEAWTAGQTLSIDQIIADVMASAP